MTGNKARVYSGYFFVFPKLSPESNTYFSIDAESHKNLMHCLNNEYPFQSCTIDKHGNDELYVSDDINYEGEDFTVGENGDFPKFGFICDNDPDIADMTESKKKFQPYLEYHFQKYNVPCDLETTKFGKYFWVIEIPSHT